MEMEARMHRAQRSGRKVIKKGSVELLKFVNKPERLPFLPSAN
jgi:hypothetical protein